MSFDIERAKELLEGPEQKCVMRDLHVSYAFLIKKELHVEKLYSVPTLEIRLVTDVF